MAYGNADETIRALCTGWKVYSFDNQSLTWTYDENDPASHGSGTSFTYTHPTPSIPRKVEWQFQVQAYVDAAPLGDGSTTGSGWYDIGSTATLTASANGTSAFHHWEDLPEGVDGSSASVRGCVKSFR